MSRASCLESTVCKLKTLKCQNLVKIGKSQPSVTDEARRECEETMRRSSLTLWAVIGNQCMELG